MERIWILDIFIVRKEGKLMEDSTVAKHEGVYMFDRCWGIIIRIETKFLGDIVAEVKKICWPCLT